MPPKIPFDYEILLLITCAYLLLDNRSYFGFHSSFPDYYLLFEETGRLILMAFTFIC